MNTHETPEDLERGVRETRRKMDGIVGELDRRRHDMLDWRRQLKRHTGTLAVAAVGLLLVIAGTATLSALRKRRRQQPLEKARLLRQALSRIIAHPELVAEPRPSVTRKALGAAAGAAAGNLAKTLVQRLTQSGAAPRTGSAPGENG